METALYKYRGPVGDLFCLFEGGVLIDMSMGKDAAAGCKQGAIKVNKNVSPAARAFFRELDAYFEGTLRKFSREIGFSSGTPFERRIWKVLLGIPYGETRSYKWVAERAGRPGAARAAGRAIGKNPIPIVVPCHRVIASDGSLGGFSCGVEIKRWLLEHESACR